ncbi:hypothetical protein J11TS1_39440 [Oceanobacillus sp. J11TS1]|nr:hypothetical protein J11TS1_39440 [Oceanobacillus sp. J11TS1]
MMRKVYVKETTKINADGDRVQIVKVYPNKVKDFSYVVFR